MGKVTYKITLSDIVDETKLTRSDKAQLKKQLGNYVVEQILEDTSKQISSVSGQRWKGLTNESYKKLKSKESSSTSANLELTGAMLDALQAKNRADGLEVGIFRNAEAKKADGHCHTGVFGESRLPKRQFIPGEGENLRAGIIKEMKKIANEFIEDKED